MTSVAASPPSSAWRQPVFWLVLGLPVLGIVAGVGIVVAAVNSGGSDALSSRVRRTAQIQLEDTEADLAALQRGLRAELLRDGEHGLLSVSVSGGIAADELELQLLHPTQARQDRRLVLRRRGERWIGDAGSAIGGRWTLRLQPRDGSWRLAGRLDANAAHATLQPLWQQ